MKNATYFCRAARWLSRSIRAALLLAGMSASAQSFVHPGLLHTQADFDRMKTKVDANAEPWKSGWDVLTANSHSSLTRAFTNPVPSIVYRGFDGVHTENYASLFRDAASAYATALRWKISGDDAYAEKSIAIMNAWSAGMTEISGTSDKFLLAGIQGYQLANAAEILRTYSGWAPADFARFQNWMLTVFYSMNHDFLVHHNGACISNYWANWDLCNMASMLAIGVLCDRRDIYNEAVTYFQTGAGMGSILNVVPFLYGSLGQWQESGRDQGHTVLGVALAGSLCEMAWNQGDDLYGYDSNRLLKGFEYIAQYNLGYEVPYSTYSNCIGVVQTIVSADGRGNLRPVWEMVYNHYARRKGLSLPHIERFAQIVRPEGGGGNFGPNSGGYDQLGYGTLTFTRDDAPRPNSQTITFPPISAKEYNAPDFNPGAMASSGLAVVYSVADPTIASVNTDGTLHVLKSGTTSVLAQQMGDATYNPAPIVSQTLTVNPIPGVTDGTWSNATGTTTSTISSTAGSADLTWPGQTFVIGDLVRLTGTVPGGFTTGTAYHVVATSGNTIQLSNRPGGTPFTATTAISNGTGIRFQKWSVAANWSGGTIPGGAQSTATFGATNFSNIGGVTMDGNITIGSLVYASNGTSELHLASGLNGGTLTFSTLSGVPSITMINSGTRKLFLGNAINNARVPLKIAGTQGLRVVTPVYGGGNPAGLRIQAAMDWSGLTGGFTLAQGTIELHNTTPNATDADNVLLPLQRFSVGTEGIAFVAFTGTNASKQTVGALDGTEDAYLVAKTSINNGNATLVIGADNQNGNYEGKIGIGPASQAGDMGRLDIEKTGAGTQTIAGTIYNGNTSGGASNPSRVTVHAGKLILNGNNQYLGATAVNGGMLVVNGAGVSPVTVNAGTLGGSGTIAAVLTIGTGAGTGATIAPGNSVGTLTTTAATSLLSDATYAVEYSSPTPAFDKLVTNGLTLQNARLTLTDLGSGTALPTGTWTIVDNTGSGPVSGTFLGLAEGATLVSGVNTFVISYLGGTGNDVTLTVASGSLPVTWLDFRATVMASGEVALSWSTAAERSNHHFEIQRSADAKQFEAIGTVPAAGIRRYAFTDVRPLGGVSYYRLKQVDTDGVFDYGRVVSVDTRGTFQVGPNPSADIVRLQLPEATTLARVQVTDVTGRVCLQSFRPELSLRLLTTGVYILRAEMTDGRVFTRKITRND